MQIEYSKNEVYVFSRKNKKSGKKEYARFDKVLNGVYVQRTPWKVAKD